MLNQVSILIGHNDLCSKSCLSPFQRIGLSRWLFHRLYFVEELYYIRNLSRWWSGSLTMLMIDNPVMNLKLMLTTIQASCCGAPGLWTKLAKDPEDPLHQPSQDLRRPVGAHPGDALQNHHMFAHNDFIIKLWMMTTPLTRSASPWIWWTRGNSVRSSPTLMSVLASLDQDLALLAGDRLCHEDDGDHDSPWNWWNF